MPAKPAGVDETLKQLGMILFESMGVGVTLVLLVLAGVLLLVGVYVQVVWPLTGWDLVSVKFEDYESLATMFLTTVFIFGFFAGYWYISGSASKQIKTRVPQNALPRSRR